MYINTSGRVEENLKKIKDTIHIIDKFKEQAVIQGNWLPNLFSP
jgi:hypothetical protein